MMSYDKYERGHQHLNGGHQRITYKDNNNNNEVLWLNEKHIEEGLHHKNL